MSSPPTPTGVDDPMFVCGAIEDVRGLPDPDSGRGGARPVGRDVDEHRDLRRELGLDDLAHRLGEPAGRVEDDDGGGCASRPAR